MPILLPIIIASGIYLWLANDTGKNLAAAEEAPNPAPFVPPRLPESPPPGVPAVPPQGGIRAPVAPAAAPSSTNRILIVLGVGFVVWKVLGALYKASQPPPSSQPRVVVINNNPKRKPRVVRIPGNRGRQRGVWTKKGKGPYTFQPFTGRP